MRLWSPLVMLNGLTVLLFQVAWAEPSLKTYTLPDISEWQDPNIGTEPVVSGAPAVIGGVLQQ